MVLFVLIILSDLGFETMPTVLERWRLSLTIAKIPDFCLSYPWQVQLQSRGVVSQRTGENRCNTIVKPLSPLSRTRDYNNSPPLSIHTHIHTRTLTRRKKNSYSIILCFLCIPLSLSLSDSFLPFFLWCSSFLSFAWGFICFRRRFAHQTETLLIMGPAGIALPIGVVMNSINCSE